MATKICPSCSTEKDILEFNKDKQTKSGYSCYCKVCKSLKHLEYKKTLDKDILYNRRRLQYLNNKDWENKRNNDYRITHKDKILEANKLYYLNNKDIYLKSYNKRKINKLKRIPSWLSKTDELLIDALYKSSRRISECLGIKFHVDHIIPLQGKLVSGLHIPSNLQIISSLHNLRKNNRFDIGGYFASSSKSYNI